MGKNFVSEIFGFPSKNNEKIATSFRSKFLCPFQDNKYNAFEECDPVNKKSNLTDEDGKLILAHQTGACSVYHSFKNQTNKPIIICPYRFLEKNKNGDVKIFKYIQNKFFNEKILYFIPEIGLKGYGRADWMICNIDESNGSQKITDIAHLEFQSDATTGTRELVQCVADFFNGKEIEGSTYGFGLNSKSSIKGSSLQMIDKGFLFEKLKKKSFWVLQDTLFNILSEIYNVKMLDVTSRDVPKEDTLIFIVTTLEFNKIENKYDLEVSKCYSISAATLQRAMSEKIVDHDDMIKTVIESIKKKIKNKNYYRIMP
jgi:hypothetical protein